MSVNFSLVLDGTDHASNSITATGNSPNSPFSTSFWFKTTNAAGGTRVIVSKGIDGVPDGWFFFIENDGTVHCEIADGTNSRLPSGGSGWNDGAWHNVILTFSNPDAKLYIDGVLLSTSTGLTLTNQTTQSIKVGNTAVAPSYIGQLCDVRVYSITLSSSDVTSIFAGNEPEPGSLLLEWPPTEGSGTTVSDFTGNGNTLTFNAVAWSTDVPAPLRPPALTLTLMDSVSSSDSMTDAFGVPLSDSVSSADSAPESFSVQSDFVVPTTTPVVETLVSQLIPAATKIYFNIQE